MQLIKYNIRYYRNMGLTYSDAIFEEFGEREFGARDLAALLGTSRASKILSELKTRGAIARVGRGRYRALRPSERPDLRLAEWNRIRSIILAGPEPKAWADASAVETWTDGRYRIAPNPFLRVFHVAVPRTRVAEWRHYLISRGVAVDGLKRVGGTVVLSPREKLRVERHNREPVVPLAETKRLIEEHPGLYAGAGALIETRS